MRKHKKTHDQSINSTIVVGGMMVKGAVGGGGGGCGGQQGVRGIGSVYCYAVSLVFL